MDNYVCDVCNEPIEDTGMAMVKFRDSGLSSGGLPDRFYDLIVCHKRTCDDLDDGRDKWYELFSLDEEDRHWIRDALLSGERAYIGGRVAA